MDEIGDVDLVVVGREPRTSIDRHDIRQGEREVVVPGGNKRARGQLAQGRSHRGFLAQFSGAVEVEADDAQDIGLVGGERAEIDLAARQERDTTVRPAGGGDGDASIGEGDDVAQDRPRRDAQLAGELGGRRRVMGLESGQHLEDALWSAHERSFD